MTGFKSEITVHLNTLLLEALGKTPEPNAYLDEVLSGYFGITYAEAYPGCSEGKWPGVCLI